MSQNIPQTPSKDWDKQHDVQVAAYWIQLAEMQPGLSQVPVLWATGQNICTSTII